MKQGNQNPQNNKIDHWGLFNIQANTTFQKYCKQLPCKEEVGWLRHPVGSITSRSLKSVFLPWGGWARAHFPKQRLVIEPRHPGASTIGSKLLDGDRSHQSWMDDKQIRNGWQMARKLTVFSHSNRSPLDLYIIFSCKVTIHCLHLKDLSLKCLPEGFE